MAKPVPRVLEVKGITDITPNMRRITLGGKGMKGFPAEQESAYIEVLSEDDIQSLEKPKNIEIEWVVKAQASDSSYPLLERIKALSWLDGTPAVWAACEFNSIRALRQYFKKKMSVKLIYISQATGNWIIVKMSTRS